MKLVRGVVLLPKRQKVDPGVNQGRFPQTNVFLIRRLAIGYVLFTLDAIPGNVFQQRVYDWLLGSGASDGHCWCGNCSRRA